VFDYRNFAFEHKGGALLLFSNAVECGQLTTGFFSIILKHNPVKTQAQSLMHLFYANGCVLVFYFIVLWFARKMYYGQKKFI